jgi:hypothetical protein
MILARDMTCQLYRALGCLASLSVAASMSWGQATAQRAVLDQYCVTCHNQKLKTPGLMLDRLNLDQIGSNVFRRRNRTPGRQFGPSLVELE